MHKKLIMPLEISWLNFNARVLQEANDPSMPLKERIRFLGIHSSNRDEFFRVRVSVLKKMIEFHERSQDFHGKSPQKTLKQIHRIVLQQQKDFNLIWKKIIHDLKKEKVFLLDDKRLNAKQKTFVIDFFDQTVSSSIIPLFIENMSQMPSFGDRNIFLGILMKGNSEALNRKFAIIEIPTKNHPRFIPLPSSSGEQNFILLEDVIRFNLSKIFSPLGYTHFEGHMFKVTKDADFDIDNDFSINFAEQIELGVKNRRKAKPIRFIYESGMSKELLEFLIRKLNLSQKDGIIPGGHIRNFCDFMDFPAQLIDRWNPPKPFKHPILAKSLRVYDAIMEQDVLLHLPYHSFNSIIDMLREAAMDPDVISLKITAYRLAPNSKICNALINAVRNGKQVHIFLELRARFDEEANLEWKTKLEEEGVKVIVGIPHLKVHAKIGLIKKKVGQKIVHYGFIGTGNLNEITALSYTDHFLLTSHRFIMADLNRIFKALENPETNWWEFEACHTLLVSPSTMRSKLTSMISREIKSARTDKPSNIIVNLNSLSDEKLIRKLYKAASAGVKIQMITRGIFCPVFNRDEFKQPITAISIVDEFLEHGRIWSFHNRGEEEIYISSADWMVRNMDHRIEVAVPILDETLKNELKHILKIKLSDNVKARWLDTKSCNQYVSAVGKKKVRSQLAIYHYLKRKG